jgi:hypothetical protein
MTRYLFICLKIYFSVVFFIYRYSSTISNNSLIFAVTSEQVNEFLNEINKDLDFQNLIKQAFDDNLWTQMFYLVSF